jgi:hypothetical protein
VTILMENSDEEAIARPPVAVTVCNNCTGCFEKSFAMVIEMLLCGECYKNVYT